MAGAAATAWLESSRSNPRDGAQAALSGRVGKGDLDVLWVPSTLPPPQEQSDHEK